MVDEKYLAIVILVGGKSTRFGTDKAVVELLEKPLILHQIETLAEFDEDIYLIARSPNQVYKYQKAIDFPREVKFLVDDREMFDYHKINKPTLGVYSGFKELYNLNFEKAFLLSCDIPLVKSEVIELMIKEAEGYECCIPRWENGYLEPFLAIYPVEKTFNQAKKNLQTKIFGVLNLINENWEINYISVEEKIRPLDKNLVSLININGPIDLERLVRLYK